MIFEYKNITINTKLVESITNPEIEGNQPLNYGMVQFSFMVQFSSGRVMELIYDTLVETNEAHRLIRESFNT